MKEEYYTILGVSAARTREVLAVVNFPTESSYGWQKVLEGLKQRGVTRLGLVVCDGLPGIEKAVVKVYSIVDIQLMCQSSAS